LLKYKEKRFQKVFLFLQDKMLLTKFTAIAVLFLVSSSIAIKEDDSFEENDDSFYDSRGELIFEAHCVNVSKVLSLIQ
jgi:hypothetical protein